MAQIKVLLEKDEEWDDIKDDLIKAFSEENGIHQHIDEHRRPFEDPVLQELHLKINKEFSEMFDGMFGEIETVIQNPQLSDYYE